MLYQTEDGRQRIEVYLQNETVWLSQKLMAELFQTTPQNINMHLKNIFSEGEISQEELLCVEMEGAAVAQVAFEYNVPCLIIRIISDEANHKAYDDFLFF